ncbi:unnamed protein product [Ascophyllum nodosum]
MSLSARFEAMEKQRGFPRPAVSQGAVVRRDVMETRRKVGRQTQIDARRQNVPNVKPVMRAAQAKVVAPRQPQQYQRQQGRWQANQQQPRQRGRGFQGNFNRTATRPGGMPPRGNTNQRAASRGSGSGRGAPAAGPGGRGNSAAAGRGSRGGRGGRGGRGSGGDSRSGGRGNSFKKPEKKEVDLDQGLDEYWFKAGKGPDPKVASMDRSLDSYWNKAKGGSEADGDVKMVSETPANASASPAGTDPEI